MKKTSVVFKLFIATTVLVFIIFSLIMLAQGMFFDRFYQQFKINELKQNMTQFKEQYVELETNERESSRLLGNFINDTDASIALIGENLVQVDVDPYFIELHTGSATVMVRVPTEGMTMKDFPLQLRIGDSVVVDGFYVDEADTIMKAIKIQQQPSELEEGISRVEGRIIDLVMPNTRAFNPFYQDSRLKDALDDQRRAFETPAESEAFMARMQSGEPIQSEWVDPWSGVMYAIVILSLSSEGSEKLYLYGMTSLQPVGDAVVILKRYVFYLAPAILILVIVLSFIFSRIISKPLLSLNRTAARMAKLDFSAQTTIRSKDEFGELSRSMNTLSHNLDSALKDLTNANVKLQGDMEEKQRLEQLRKELIANISHELKTPLGIVKGFAEGLQDGVAEEKKERYLSLLLNEVDRMNALIMDMMELSKFEAKAIRLHPAPISIVKLVQHVGATFTRQLESKQLTVQVNATEEPIVWADTRWMEQVIVNLLSNAIRHAWEQSVIRVHIQVVTSDRVMIRIENDGPTIKEEDLGRIWDQFYRAEPSRDRKLGGTGLGLAMVKHILELHGSEYGVENTAQGIAFYFSLNQDETDLH